MSSAPRPRPPSTQSRWSWRSQALRGWVYQALALAVIAAALAWLAHNTLANMRERGIQSGFDFLLATAGFDIGEGLLAYESNQPYWRAFLAGVLNTLRVALPGVLLATVLGTLVGVGSLSRSALVRAFCRAYVEAFRNLPLLLQLLMWYLLFTELLPDPTAPWQGGGWYLSKGGLSMPLPVWGETGLLLQWPRQGEFAVEGGAALTPEFMALLLGLVFYTAAFVAEVVRAGVQSVVRGQSEAAAALGLSRRLALRLVVLPQALRVIIPPLTNQYLNLTKNSSLAVAIGYPDVVSIANTALNQTGRAVECIAIIMLIYLSTSLLTAWVMSRYNRRAAIRER